MARVKATTYAAVAEIFKLDDHTANLYVRYMQARWPGKEDEHCRYGYAQEWAIRFQEKLEWQASDREGREVLRRLTYTAESSRNKGPRLVDSDGR